MRDWFNKFIYGRRGMDELSKFLFWFGLGMFLLSLALQSVIAGLAGLFRTFGLLFLIFCFIRAFSRDFARRERENGLFLTYVDQQKQKLAAAKNRRSQRKDFRFFRCPGCKTYLRVPVGKGKIHIKCKCGYILYRKT